MYISQYNITRDCKLRLHRDNICYSHLNHLHFMPACLLKSKVYKKNQVRTAKVFLRY